MEKHNKDLENIKVERDYLQANLKETNANYWNLKAYKDILNVEHNKLHSDYKNMEQTLLKQHKELEELKMQRMTYKGKLIKSMHRWTKICRSKWLLMKSCKNF
jgi:uncharacterized coiled-coil DUF342 family protein